MRTIILASASPRRKQLLESVGLQFKVVPSNIEEKMNPRLGAVTQAERLSHKKALSVASQFENKDVIIISADTIVVSDGEQLGKPTSEKQAGRMLSKLSGKKILVVTGFTVFAPASRKSVTKSAKTYLWMKKISESEKSSYIKHGNVFDKSGAFAIEGAGELLVERIEGDYSNVLGLPLSQLYKELKKFGISLL